MATTWRSGGTTIAFGNYRYNHDSSLLLNNGLKFMGNTLKAGFRYVLFDNGSDEVLINKFGCESLVYVEGIVPGNRLVLVELKSSLL